MRSAVRFVTLLAVALTAAPHAQGQARPRPPVAGPARGGPPHAWLFGVWTGGLFPVLDGMLAQDCRTQPTVAFAQDVVGHASLLGTTSTQRVIETVRTSPGGAEFQFTPLAGAEGFGCDDVNVLHVARRSEEAIDFPKCAAFPYPLQRCSRG